ncbi:tetratricopeptide repeat protein 39B isoform X1 [Trichechus manatus latirostris]|uniref:Tetratricopeptide repeat protein 39B n=1 Tax=Trichechus manatus latirostris TaxID=127582 RepID=A0A2Y9QSL8_TRIMA|nr:tetratricopeptide repeat protein 39B isoform X1 [Trichechus manatus latirostris]XP_023584386.1 tetratricopeptide repeat protein 39B isoform X1 [Trichechus manatus latirostris]
MALVGNGAELEADEDIFEDALETIPVSSPSDMEGSSHHFTAFDSKQASGHHEASNLSRSSNACIRPSPYKHIVEQPRRTSAKRSEISDLDKKSASAKISLNTGLEECAVALNLFLSNKFSDALELLRPWAKDSMYHALGYSTIVVLQAVMTFEQQDIQNGISAMKDALQTCQRYRKKSTVVESFSSLLSRGSLEQLTEEEMHAEICYAECLLQKAALTFVQDENMISFIKGGLKIRTSYQIYKECLSILHVIEKNKLEQQLFYEFEGGVKLGVGAFNLMLSLLPARIIRLLEFIGFSGNRELGLMQLREGASGRSMRAPLCCLTILGFHTYICLILGTGEVNIVEAESLLAPFLQQFPNGSLMLFYHARIELLKGNVEEAQETFRKCISVQEEWKQFHHLCYWELMWIYVFEQNWMQAYYYSDLLCKESKWSKAIYVFLKAAILSMLPEEDVVSTKENVVALFRQVESLKQRIAGKSIPTEKFAVRKARRYSPMLPAPVKLVLPALEMMYVWNGFPVVSKRKDLSENLLVTVEKAEAALQKENSNDYFTDDECLVKLLKGCCLKNLQRPLQAELCFNHVIQSEKLLKYDHYLVPFTLFELAFLHKSQGEMDKAIKVLETARTNYKDYSMESRLHFRIQAALHLWKKPPSN